MLALDPSSLLPFILTAIVIVLGSLFIVKKAASKYLAASFETSEGYGYRHWMSIGGGGGAGAGAACVVCGRSGPKICSRCKSVRYCSEACQTKHWATEHKLKCKPVQSSDRVASIPSVEGDLRRGKSSGSGSISLVPARGVCKVLKEPKEILFPYDEFIKLFNWDKPGFPPCGLLNFRNSCFANVVLQCLASTRPLIAFLLEKDHSRTCFRKLEDWCFLCELQAHIHRSSQSRQPFSPINILSRIPKIGGNLDYGSQEDAHEFMRFAIDTMQSVCLDEFGGEKALDPSTQETTLIQHIFGGHLQSQVKCTKCNITSNRYENMMDLTVEIHGDAESDSLEECLDQFTVKEWLDGDNKYKCDGCYGYVEAWKRLTVHQAPNILTITLKRFQSGKFGKLNKIITFPEELDLTPYMSKDGDGAELYSLYAVVVHIDMLNASYFGHYICYTKDYYGKWYRIDDCKVTVVDVEEVLSQGAYMLLYSRKTARKEPFVKPGKPTKEENLAVKEVDSLDAPSGETVSSDLASNNDTESNLCLLRDTGHERSVEIETSTINGKADSEVEVNSSLLREDLADTVRHNSKLNSLETETDTTKESLDLDVEVNSTLLHKVPEDAEMNGPELNSLDTTQGKEHLGVEVNLMLVHKDLEDANTNQGELSSLEMKTDTVKGKENFDVELNSILVLKDLDDVDINEVEDMECEAPSCVSDTNLHIVSSSKNTVANGVHKMVTPSFEANMNRGELSSLEMDTDTVSMKENFDVEANSILVHKDLHDVDINEVEDMVCKAPSWVSDTNLHIESSSKNTVADGVHNTVTPSFEAYVTSSLNEQACLNTSGLNQDTLGSSNGVDKQLDHEMRTETENPNFAASTMANGYINGHLELVNEADAPPVSNMALVNSNFINPIKLDLGAEAVCLSENCRCNVMSTFKDDGKINGGGNCESKLINGACSWKAAEI